MTNITQHFIKGSDNKITLNLQEAGADITSTPTRVALAFYTPYGSEVLLVIERTTLGTGITYTDGTLELTPGDMPDDVSLLVVGRLYRVEVSFETASEDNGVVYGGSDSEGGGRLYFAIGQNGAP